MIGLEDVYKVVAAMVPLYVALLLGYGSVRWWHIFTQEQCDAINRFVCLFTLPLFTFDFTAHIDPFKMNYRFIGADVISKVIIVVVLAFWARFSSKGSYCWSITSFSLSTLTNSLVVGIPLIRAMYGQEFVDLVVQGSVFQAIVWLTALLFVLECRRATTTNFSINVTTESKDLEGNLKSIDHQDVSTKSTFMSLVKVVSWKLSMNPNSYSCVIGIIWATISKRFNWPMPDMIEGSVVIMSKAGIGTAMFSMGLFMAKQDRLICCGTSLAVVAIVLKFFAGPAAMAISCIAVGLRGDVLRVAVMQAALPQSITSFIYAKEYGLHADVLSTAVIFGMIVTLPILVGFYALLEFLP
ncbi:auxin efflux carrier component 5 [Rutidosis leptorrhynchoides]|uniref:auxin efflux carrier component 5 n=1 Tax=Rutidosis leptorrhynchoides TaxID=125765 RepID=UPI003A99407C